MARRRAARPSRSARWVAAHARLTTPRPDGLPNTLVLVAFPAVVLLTIVGLTLVSISGSSTGIWWILLGAGDDPHLISGMPRLIRSDEWLVQSSWVVSQVSQGFHATNGVFPGGTDATVMNDLPTWDWSTLFRPHVWGFLFFGLDHGMAVRWWLPAGFMITAAYFFVVTMLPRRPLLGAVLALTVLFQPLIQWWWLPIAPLPVAFAFTAMAAVVWGARCDRRLLRILPAAAAAYLAVAMAMSIYVPFMIPAILSVAAFTVGHALHRWRTEGVKPHTVAWGLAPILIAGAAAASVVGLWLFTRRATVEALFATVYPGQRLTAPGSGTIDEFTSLLSAPFQRSLQSDQWAGLGRNQSEAAAPLLISVFLVLPLLGIIHARWRKSREVDWLVISLIAVQCVLFAFLYLPGWDGLAHLIGIDRAVPERLRLAFVILAILCVVVLIRRLEELESRSPWVLALGGGVLVVAASVFVAVRLASVEEAAGMTTASVIATGLTALAVVAIARRRAAMGGVLLLCCSLLIGAGVNPIYRGVFDLPTDSTAGRDVVDINAADPDGRWVGVGSYLASAMLVEAGVPAYSGVQTYPSRVMWSQIDPTGAHEEAWNRLAHIYWVAGGGEPDPRQPPEGYADQVYLTFDSCASFAQEYVSYVLSDGVPIDQPCLEQLTSVTQGPARQWIYRVVPARNSDRPSA